MLLGVQRAFQPSRQEAVDHLRDALETMHCATCWINEKKILKTVQVG